MTPPQTVDVDLDALAPAPKRVKLAGKVWRLPGDMPMDLFMRMQTYGPRLLDGADESELLAELQGELLALFQEYQPTLKKLPAMGFVQLMRALGDIYGPGEPPGEAAPPAGNRVARRARTRTPSKAPSPRRPATSA